MQVALVDASRQVGAPALERAVVAQRGAATAVTEAREVNSAKEPVVATTAGRIGPMRGGLRSLDTGLNQRIAASQRTIEFLRRAEAQLQTVHSAIAAQVGAGHNRVDAGVIDLSQEIRKFETLWRERAVATGGTLDNRLNHVEPGTAEVRFKVRGLTLDSLTKGEREMLYLAVRGRTDRAAAVAVGTGLDAAEITQRLHRALAPNGVRVHRDLQGELVFSVREAEWTGARDLLTIKGDGRRFPTGQFAAARIDPEQPLIRPDEWSVDGSAALRETLEKVVAAQNAVRQARQLASEALNERGRQLTTLDEASGRQEGAWCADFARTFAATAGKGDYRIVSALSSALLGIHRDRVAALLAPP